MIQETTINLCDEILKEMVNLEFNTTAILKVKDEIHKKNAESVAPNIQKVLLTIIFFKILVNGKHIPPSEIRLALNSGESYVDWLQDFKLIILPFLKENENKFF